MVVTSNDIRPISGFEVDREADLDAKQLDSLCAKLNIEMRHKS